MAAIVKANSSLANGGLAVLRRSYSTTDEGTLTYEAEYCCLAQFANNYIARFRTGSTPPTPIPASMSALRIDGAPKLYDLTTNTQNGLTYFGARYSAASLDAGEVITTESQEQRSFSAVVTGTIRTAGNLGNTITVTGDVTVSFDYVSTTIRVEAKNPRALPAVRGRVGRPFNVSASLLAGQVANTLGQFRESAVETQSKTRSSRGNYTYTKSSSGIYEVTQNGLL
jgi:hypothetical protein